MRTRYIIKKLILTQAIPLILFISGGTNQVVAQRINYKSQSLYIYIFSKNIYWPESSLKDRFVIGVYGNSPILNELKLMASLKKTQGGREIVVNHINSINDIKDEQILYITSSKSRELQRIIERIGKKSTLIVAERDGLAKKGASINFLVMDNDNLKFEVNTEALADQKLKMSDELLKRGFVVK